MKREGIKSLKELDVMSKLVHPNLVRAEGILVGINGAVTVGIIMPLAATDLQRMMSNPTVTTLQRLKILFDILNGVKYLHDSGYIHLDLKPMNVLMFGKDNTIIAKLTDFGISLILERNVRGELEKYYPSELVTVTHRAPEILAGDRNYSKASDMWSLGMIFLEVLSGGKSIYSDFTKSKVKTSNKKFLSPGMIDQTLNIFLAGLEPQIRTDGITIIRRMLDFNPKNRPTVDQVMKSKLFTHMGVKNLSHGMVIYKRPYPPRHCNLIYYYGFDYLVRLAMKFPIKTETFFLAADIYQRSLAYGHHLTGNFNKDWPNVALTATTSLYMAIKMTEPYSPNLKKLVALASEIFNEDDLVKVEAALTQLFEGIIYSKNLFTETVGKDRLVYAFELLHNCHIYYRIDLDKWKRENPKLLDGYNKYDLFSNYIVLTEYFKLMDKKQKEYLPNLYKKDLTLV